MASYYVYDASFFSRRAIVFVAIVGLHVGIAVMIASGLARKVIEVIAPPIETNLIEEVKQRDEPPPPPPPQFERPPIEVPPPEVTIDIPVESTSTAITDVTTRHVERPAPTPRAVIKAKGKFPNTDDYYPPASNRLGEEGAATVHYCVGADSKLTGSPVVMTSSKSPRLDEAAIRLVKAARFTAGSIDGAPNPNDCQNIIIRFQLKTK